MSPGFVLCDSLNPITVGRKFDAQLVILEHKSIICAGYSAVMHIHCAAEEITVAVSIIHFEIEFSMSIALSCSLPISNQNYNHFSAVYLSFSGIALLS